MIKEDQLPPAAISGRRLMAKAEEIWGPLCCWKCYKGHKICVPMILCPMCGNKRCPKASDHELACTGSNASGQPGSIFE